MAELTLPSAVAGASPQSWPPPATGPCILALDLGTTTGWALRTADGLITSGTVSFRPRRFEGCGMRYLRLTRWLTEVDRLCGPITTIWFEEVRRHAGTDAAHVYGGLLATLTAWAELRGVPYLGVPVGTIKRHAPAKGNADNRARGFAPADDNEADAIALLLWAMETNGGWHEDDAPAAAVGPPPPRSRSVRADLGRASSGSWARNSMASAARQGRRSDEHVDTAPGRVSAGGSSIRTQAFAGAAPARLLQHLARVFPRLL